MKLTLRFDAKCGSCHTQLLGEGYEVSVKVYRVSSRSSPAEYLIDEKSHAQGVLCPSCYNGIHGLIFGRI